MNRETIFALSSGVPPAAIAIVRISGPAADEALATLLCGASTLPPARKASLRTLRAPDGEILDRAVVVRFPGPGSATGEDLVELHLHGGVAVVEAVLKALALISDLRSAQPGEFTRRAFANGRIDLIEAEGLADLLQAQTEAQRRNALALADGGLSRAVGRWYSAILSLSAAVEAELDFSDEDDVAGLNFAQLKHDAAAIGGELRMLLDRPPAERLHEGARILLAGRPNAGKSTLFNRLVGRDAAIVSPLAGTTRDVIEAPVLFDGRSAVFVDCAGLRADSADPIEQVGIARAEAELRRADLILALDGSVPEALVSGRVIWVHAKADLEDESSADIAFGDAMASSVVRVSAQTGEGMDILIDRISGWLAQGVFAPEDGILLRQRQREALAQAQLALEAAGTETDLLLVAECLRRALAAFDALLGRTDVEQVLDSLFARFCIGK